METETNTIKTTEQKTDASSWKENSFASGAITGVIICAVIAVPVFLWRMSAEFTFANFLGTLFVCGVITGLVSVSLGFIALESKTQERDSETPITIRDKHTRTYPVRFQDGWSRLRDYLAENVSAQTSGWKVPTADTKKRRIVAYTEQTVQAPIDASVDYGQLQLYAESIGRKSIYQAVVNLRIQTEITVTNTDGGTTFGFNWTTHIANKDQGQYASQDYLKQIFWDTFDRFYADLDKMFGEPELPYYMKHKKDMQPWEDGVNM